ncbi:WD40 and Vps8 domain-containing protein [Phanerochaete sordida]|uniref:WD40 and Vps8 domain-containing protein n=1 Tax=Phanerochaete sordida TaxID=48140 RepID=A0A9P3LFK0_9APHY|nr:WD40 and Vps8 domain-containing protein [Phanerochaete sordida]
MNGTLGSNNRLSAGRSASPVFSDMGMEEVPDDDHLGDYSTRLEELMSDDEPSDDRGQEDEDEEDEGEGFFYNGVDAEPSGTYREQLRDVLGPDHEDDDASDPLEVRQDVLHDVQEKEMFEASMDDEARPADLSSDLSPAASSSASASGYLSPPKVVVSPASGAPVKAMRPFLHPTISRLRSTTPQASRTSSVTSIGTIDSKLGISTPMSHFSALSPTSSQSNLPEAPARGPDASSQDEREVFRWSQLRNVTELLYQGHAQKVSSLIGAPNLGSPTVLAANGLICVGTDLGRILVFDFKQNFKCVCSSPEQTVGAVTALALSYDHTYVASGHASGHIQLFDLNNAKTPARFVPPTSLAEVAAGRQEGHLYGSRIVSIGFVAGRHTAVVSADDSGLAFYHSLGKVLFVEASDTLRILGKYPDEADPLHEHVAPGVVMHHQFRRRRIRKAHTILSMMPLPLGAAAHPTDAYNLVALLTPVKLVVVGLKPSPKTWYRRHREVDDGPSKSRFKGVLAWYPSMPGAGAPQDSPATGKARAASPPGTHPVLVYGWGNTLSLVRVSESKMVQEVRNPKNGKVSRTEVGRVVFEEGSSWTVGGDALALQWLNPNQIIVLTSATLEVYDIHTCKLVEHVLFDAWSLVSPILGHTTNGSVQYSDAVTEVAHSVRVYKGKIFLLGQHEMRVGTLLTWADRILSFVENGNFLSAIELVRSYYVGEAPGNRNGLPEDPQELRLVVGEKMRDLMVASARYAFAEERMLDSTHYSADGRGVDRTSLFEGLVGTCARACIALNDFDLLFEDLYSYYDDNYIPRIFLAQLEPFIIDGAIHHVPPRITQKLVALHEENGRPDLAERIIWHIDPDCLDINQSIRLCQKYRLYDALMYVYMRAMKDYVAPLVELLELIRQVQRYRCRRAEASPNSKAHLDDSDAENIAVDAYKIYPYLGNALTGLAYPSGEPLSEDDAEQAKSALYEFLFAGRSRTWPEPGGRLILTNDDDTGVEPTYPYARLLLRFDSEAFLHTLDLAFEDHYLNDDEMHNINRLIVVKILLEIISSPDTTQSDATFINIFIARNVPKYSQFLYRNMAPSTLHGILIALAQDPDSSTREDRQLAAEYLLSAYTPHESHRIIRIFEEAGFYRILRSWHRSERQWAPLIQAYLRDNDIPPGEKFTSLDEVLSTAAKCNKQDLPPEVIAIISDSLSSLLDASIPQTGLLLDRRLPALHEKVMTILADRPSRDRFLYLRSLLATPAEDSFHELGFTRTAPSPNVPPSLRSEYMKLLCEVEPAHLVDALHYLPKDFIDRMEAARVCEEYGLYDAVIWCMNDAGDSKGALHKASQFVEKLSDTLIEHLTAGDLSEASYECLAAIKNIQQRAVVVCLEQSKGAADVDRNVEENWFELLRSQITCVHRVSLSCSPRVNSSQPQDDGDDPRVQAERALLEDLRASVHETFNSLLSVSSTKAVSFPRLFKRLVDARDSRVTKGAQYTEFRAILGGMLESYRSEGDMLVITKQLMGRDLFVRVEELAKARGKGWAPSRGVCTTCGERLYDPRKAFAVDGEAEATSEDTAVIVSRTGAVYHRKCLPGQDTTNSV